MKDAFFITAKDLAAAGPDGIPEELTSAKHMIYSSPATLDFNSPGAKGFGVKRAVDKVHEYVDAGKKVYTLGPIIHNEKVIEELSARGVVVLEDVEAAERLPETIDKDGCGSVIVIRSHGVDRATDERLHVAAEKSGGRIERES